MWIHLKFFSYPLCEASANISSLFSEKFWSNTLKVFFIEFPNTLLISLFLSNLLTEVSFTVKVDCADVSLLKNSALGEIYSQNNKIAPILEVLSKDDNESVRISAIESLGLKKGTALSKKALSYSLLNDKDDEVRSNAALSFWRLSGNSLLDLNVMYDALNDSNRYVRAYILEALEQINTVKSRSILLHELKTSRWCQMTNPKSMF